MNSVVTERQSSSSTPPSSSEVESASQSPAARRASRSIDASDEQDRRVGPRSTRIPGISPGRRRPSAGAAAAAAAPSACRPCSSLGARLRSRVPQYGHSVMYGETSEPQLLQTTKRSGPLDMVD